MLVTAAALAALAGGLPVWGVGIGLGALAFPIPALVAGGPGILLWRRFAWKRREDGKVDEVALFAAVAGELRAGSSLRGALAAAAVRSGDPGMLRLARAASGGAPIADVAATLEAGLAGNGRHAARAVEVAADTGAGAAAVFTRLSTRAAAVRELQRERIALTAQARLSALVVGGLPVLAVAVMFVTGRGRVFIEAGAAGMAMAGAGVGLTVIGLGIVAAMLKAGQR